MFTDQCITSYEVFQQFSRDEFTKDLLISWGIKTAGLRIVLLDLFYECRKSKTEELSTAKETISLAEDLDGSDTTNEELMNVPDIPQDSNVTVEEEAASFDAYASMLTETELGHIDAVKDEFIQLTKERENEAMERKLSDSLNRRWNDFNEYYSFIEQQSNTTGTKSVETLSHPKFMPLERLIGLGLSLKSDIIQCDKDSSVVMKLTEAIDHMESTLLTTPDINNTLGSEANDLIQRRTDFIEQAIENNSEETTETMNQMMDELNVVSSLAGFGKRKCITGYDMVIKELQTIKEKVDEGEAPELDRVSTILKILMSSELVELLKKVIDVREQEKKTLSNQLTVMTMLFEESQAQSKQTQEAFEQLRIQLSCCKETTEAAVASSHMKIHHSTINKVLHRSMLMMPSHPLL